MDQRGLDEVDEPDGMRCCPACAADVPGTSSFCPACGAKLGESPALPEQRKLVTVLFCDLVGYTALSERTDPEDVDALLRVYYDMARGTVEAFGGVVEKFIGDAVVGVFGVPAVHEDDAERAVRAGLRLVEQARGLSGPDERPVEVRVGVNTGEALVRLDVTPGSGEGFLTGQAVNMAARLQAVAPPMGVAAGEQTHRLTRHAIVYDGLGPVLVKGKDEPIEVWLATRPLAPSGTTRVPGGPLVGRRRELAALTALLHQIGQGGPPRLAVLLGEPGIGKSRLVAELHAAVDAAPPRIRWREGRCLPYGEGVTFWPLVEIVKEHAGILSTDDAAVAEAKLEAVLPQGDDAAWLGQRLRGLLGLEAATADRHENFAAWRLFLEHMAAAGPAVVVIEDLHWADQAMLAFVEHLAAGLNDVPLLVLLVARPELLDANPRLAAALGGAEQLRLAPLSAAETEQLVASLLPAGGDAPSPVPPVWASLLQRCGGNPLFVGESVRLLQQRGLLEGAAPGLPDTVQAIIAARLDTLPPQQRKLLADASVIGDVFWDGAVEALDGWDRRSVDTTLDDLATVGLVHPRESSSMDGQAEFAFGHVLTRDVAYQELTRPVRAAKHKAAAEWIERTVGGRGDELAEVVAHHYCTALDLATAARQTSLAGQVRPQAVRTLLRAGDRVIGLDPAAAERHYRRALRLLGEDHPERPAAMLRRGRSLSRLGRFREAADTLVQAGLDLRKAGDRRGAAVALRCLSSVRALLGEPGELELATEAVDLLEDDGPSPELARALSGLAGVYVIAYDPGPAVAAAERAIAVSRALGLPDPAEALGFAAMARCDLGDPRGLDELPRAIQAARDQGLAHEACLNMAHLGCALFEARGAAEALAVHEEALRDARRRGDRLMTFEIGMQVVDGRFWAGHWDEAGRLSCELDDPLAEAADTFNLAGCRAARLLAVTLRGEAGPQVPLVHWVMGACRETADPGLITVSAAAAATALAELGDREEATGLLRRCLSTPRAREYTDFIVRLPQLIRTALSLGDQDLAGALAEEVTARRPVHEAALAAALALLAESDEEHEAAAAGFADAAARWHVLAIPYERGQALLGQARCLMALGREPEARRPLNEARAIFEELRATPALIESTALLE